MSNEKSQRNAPLTDRQKAKNKTKSKVRAAVEHPFLTIKQIFDFSKVCYRGLQKNAHRFFMACGLDNLHRAPTLDATRQERCPRCDMKYGKPDKKGTNSSTAARKMRVFDQKIRLI